MSFIRFGCVIIKRFSKPILAIWFILIICMNIWEKSSINQKKYFHVLNYKSSENNSYSLNENFTIFFPSKITMKKLYTRGKLSLDFPLMPDLVNHTREIFNASCKNNTKIVVLVNSDPLNYDLRKDIRESFGNNQKKYKYEDPANLMTNSSHCFIYIIGYTDDKNLNQKVDFESFSKKDIIRIPILEDYHNKSHKVILALHLINQISTNFEMVLKTEDDIFIKVNKMVPFAMGIEKELVFIGEKMYNVRTERNPNNFRFVSEEEYSDYRLKPYIAEFFYIVRRNIINDIVTKHYSVKTFPLEDVHISYLVEKCGYGLSDVLEIHFCDDPDDCENSYVFSFGRDVEKRKIILKDYQSEY